ncbi:MAG: hypothetical protein NVS3B20_10270 [Polyangiales bacterium]
MGDGETTLATVVGGLTSSTATGRRVRVAIASGITLASLCALFLWGTVATVDGEHAHPANAHLLSASLLLVAFAAVSGFVVAMFASVLSLAPVASLTRMVRAMPHDLEVRAGEMGFEELGELGDALDALPLRIAAERHSLEEDRDRLAAILESMIEGVLVTSSSGTIVLANAALREMFLLDRNIVGRPPIEAVRVAGLDDLLERAASSREGASGEVELIGIRPRRILVRASPLRASDSRDSGGLVAVFHDVTELRRLENMRRDFVANVSHELRTPITAIRAAAETMLGSAQTDRADVDRPRMDPEEVHDFLAIIARNAGRLQTLVEDLLELSRIEARQWRLSLEGIDLREAVQSAIDSVNATVRERGATVLNHVMEGFERARGDRRAIEQVLLNLLDNAIKYAGPKARVEVSVLLEGDSILLRVQDRGPGIEPRHLSRLFERFYRVDAGRSRAVGGTGLGLSIVKHLVEAMGGVVEVESKVGVGTTFSFSLPRESATKGKWKDATDPTVV